MGSTVLKVAATLFSERGYDSVSINDIGFAAGVTGPAIYRYFPSKEALLLSIYEHLYRRGSRVPACCINHHTSTSCFRSGSRFTRSIRFPTPSTFIAAFFNRRDHCVISFSQSPFSLNWSPDQLCAPAIFCRN